MKNTIFTGAATAIVTPMTKDGIDYAQFARLIEWQIAQGIDAIVAVGTTGEGPTLNDEGTAKRSAFVWSRWRGACPSLRVRVPTTRHMRWT